MKLLIPMGLAVLTLAAYEPVRRNAFVSYDDDVYITENPDVTGGLTLESVFRSFSTRHAGNWHPLTWISHIVDYELFGPDPLGHHIVNVILHTLSTLLLFHLLWKMTSRLWPAAFVAAVFALHPVHVESVGWAAERKDVLSGLFFFLTVAAYLRYAKQPSALRYMVVFVVYCLGLMAKPMLVTLPFVLLLLDYWPLRRPLSRLVVIEKFALLIPAVISSAVTFTIQQAAGAVTETQLVPITTRLANAAVSYIAYIGKMLYPADLAVLYPYPTAGPAQWKLVLALTILVAVTVAVFFSRRRYLVVGWLWYVGMMIPVIGLVQVGVQAMADRYTYLPSIGLTIMAAWLVADAIGKSRGKTCLAPVALLVVVAMLVCTRVQVGYWRDSISLFEHTLNVTKNNYKIEHNLGLAMVSAGRVDEGIEHYRRALRIVPAYLESHFALAEALRMQGKVNEAIDEYLQTVRLDKGHREALNNLGYALISQGRLSEAKVHFENALRIKPDWSAPLTGLAQILAVSTDDKVRDPNRAIELARRAAELTNHQNATIIDTLAVAYASAGRFEEAIAAGEAALELARLQSDQMLAQRIQKRLELYKAQEPYSAKPLAGSAAILPAKKQWATRIELAGVENLHKVSDDLYRGAQPTEEGMRELKKLGIKTIVNLRSFHSDRDEIADVNLDYERMYMKPWHPEDKEVVQFFQIVTDANRTPVFVHCQRGADRTGTMCAIYRMMVQGWSREEAIAEMTQGGFGFYAGWQDLIDYIRKLDIEQIKRQAGLEKPSS